VRGQAAQLLILASGFLILLYRILLDYVADAVLKIARFQQNP